MKNNLYKNPGDGIQKNRIGTPAALFLITSCLMTFYGCQAGAAMLSSPKYPQKTSFSDQYSISRQKEASSLDFVGDLQDFSYKSAAAVLLKDSGENTLYSPLSLYMSLAVSAAGAGGDTRLEILKALSMEDMEIQALIDQTSILFRNQYFSNEIGTFKMANSLWVQNKYNVKKEFIENMTDKLYLTSGRVDFLSASAAAKINGWISENTEGISDSADIPQDPDLVMVQLDAVQFADEWKDAINPEFTRSGPFKLSDGSLVQADYMNAAHVTSYIEKNGCTSSYLEFKNGFTMVFILPDEGASIDTILSDPDLMARAADVNDSQNRQTGEVLFQIPKFSFNTKIDLKNTLLGLGMVKAWENTADFSNISNSKPLFVSKVLQSTAISLDEKGCKASGFTQIYYSSSAIPDSAIEMKLTRPFVFLITGVDHIPVFIGKVENPLTSKS